MKHFALNKVSIARLENLHKIKGKGLDVPKPSEPIAECLSDNCEPSNMQDCNSGLPPCTNTSIDTHDATDPSDIGTSLP